MAQLQKGTTYTTGSTVTAANLNSHVSAAILLDGAVSGQTALGASPASDDVVLISDTDAATLKSATTTELLGTELAAWVGKGASGGTAALQIDGVDKLSVDSSGNTTVAGTTTMTGAATASSTLGVTGVTTLSDHLNLLTNKEARFQDAAGNEYVGVKAPTTVSSSYTLTMPPAVGADNQILQTSDASGTLEWVSPASAGTILACTYYDPATDQTHTAQSSFTAIDSTNVTVTFTAPASGNVLYRITYGHKMTNTDNTYLWLDLYDSGATAQISGTDKIASYDSAASEADYHESTDQFAWKLTGLSGSYTIYPRAKYTLNSSVDIQYGGDYTPFIIEVIEL